MLFLVAGRRHAIIPRHLATKICAGFKTRTSKLLDGSSLDALPSDALPSDALPLDALVNDLVSKIPQPTVLWSAPKKNTDVKALAHEIRARITADDPTALDLLREIPPPYPALVAHTAVHALLRAKQISRAGSVLLAYAVQRRDTIKEPRIHPVTLAETIKALLDVVPTTQGRQDRARTALRPSLLVIDAQHVSEPALRTALGLYIKARQLFVHRQKDVTVRLWNALLNQREWIPAALLFELQVKDYQLRRTLPTLLRVGKPGDRPMNPQERWHLRRRLDHLRREDIRPNRALFTDLCFRIAGVISSLARSTESGLISINPDSVPPKPDSIIRPPKKAPLTPQRAWHHARVALQALTILGGLVDARKVPFGDISAWVSTVGSLPSTLEHLPAFTLDGHPKRVYARQHLRAILERYATSLPRVPHIYSEFPFGMSGFSPPSDPAEAEDDSLMPPPLMPTYEALLSVFLNAGARGRAPGALYYYTPEEAMNATTDQQQRWNEAAERVEASLGAPKGSRIIELVYPVEEKVQHYHAPRSPNNPDPLHLQYPAHPLDFDQYPKPARVSPGDHAAATQMQKLGPTPVALYRVHVVAKVLSHMMYERSPAMPPWESEAIMQVLQRRADVLRLLIGRTGVMEEMTGVREGLWDAVWEGAARARREAEVNAAEARRIIAEGEYEVGATQERIPWSERMDSEQEEWAVDRESGVLRPANEEDESLEELEMFNRRMAARTWNKELDMYRSTAG
ncbi:hypothetical protein MSAN_00198000 [Mycena sanguinolenta]|uniref:Uncharacterized protein n=1 Tax=Mycena sanguinolenta TaxID=230812 RepID=A0A8H6ZLM7_9AGAR|nr:hypothetical protein MSAN_00198000 [Mycena sanguinolenta]